MGRSTRVDTGKLVGGNTDGGSEDCAHNVHAALPSEIHSRYDEAQKRPGLLCRAQRVGWGSGGIPSDTNIGKCLTLSATRLGACQ